MRPRQAPVGCRAASSTRTTSAMSLPSISMTRQPKALKRATRSPGSSGGRRSARGVAAPAELLELVVVDDGDEVVGAVAGRDVGRLPDLALLALAVAEQHLGQEVLAQLPAPSAMPRPAERPMPSEPVEMSMPGSLFMSG